MIRSFNKRIAHFSAWHRFRFVRHCHAVFLQANKHFIEIVDADFRGRGDLLLEHRHEGIGLDGEYARGTLTQIALLWGKPCTIRTVKGRETDEAAWFTGHPDGRSEQHDSEPQAE